MIYPHCLERAIITSIRMVCCPAWISSEESAPFVIVRFAFTTIEHLSRYVDMIVMITQRTQWRITEWLGSFVV